MKAKKIYEIQNFEQDGNLYKTLNVGQYSLGEEYMVKKLREFEAYSIKPKFKELQEGGYYIDVGNDTLQFLFTSYQQAKVHGYEVWGWGLYTDRGAELIEPNITKFDECKKIILNYKTL